MIVVDTLRATTAIVTLLSGGAKKVYPCLDHVQARAISAGLPKSRLCGETDGLPPDGFDYGNSPVEFHDMNVTDWTVVLSTSNGTPALALSQNAAVTIVACLRNRKAVVETALSLPHPIAIVCSGERYGTVPSVEDSFTAGSIVYALINSNQEYNQHAGAKIAHRVYHSYNGKPELAFDESPHAKRLHELKFNADIRFAGMVDTETIVPIAKIDSLRRIVVQTRATG